ncbi:neprilysin-2-like [Haemaphysalis longicornis]
MGLLFLVSHFVLFKSKQPAPAAVCTSPDCEKDAVFVAEHINRSADPCHDFEAFACSMWSKAGEVYGYGEGIMRLQIAAWFSGFEAVLNEALDSIEPVNRLKKMYDLCMTTDVDTTTVQNSIKELKQFMRERGLGWPHLPAKKERPLGVLLDLAYHWRLGLWFDASDLRPASAASGMRVGPRVLLIEPGAFVGAWAAQHYSVLNQSYTAYWRALERQFRDSEDDPPRTDNIEEITKRETEILNALLKVMLSNTRKPAEFPVGDIERFTPNISEAVWSEELNKKVVSLEITTLTNQSFDNITVTDTAILYTLNNLLTTYNQKEVLDHLSWFFVQVFASLADRGNLIYKFGNKVLADARRHLYCATEVEASNQFLIAAIHTRLRIPIGARKTFDEQLQTIKQAALDNIALHSTWADGDSRKKVADKVRKEKTAIWPPDELLETSVLKEMYADISLSRSTFIEYWFDAYRRIRTLLGDPRYAEAMAMARNFVLPYFDYDYISNHVRLALGTVAAPLYRAGSTYAMLYGGIGFSYAAQLVRAFDEGGLTISPDGRINASWVPAAWHTGHAKKSKCTSPLSPFPEIPALQISHAAFQRAVANLSEPPKPLMLDYSEEQVFFIAACFTLCDVEKNRYGTYSGRCNKMVQNVPAFAAAFSCLDGSKMKPARPCPYFD